MKWLKNTLAATLSFTLVLGGLAFWNPQTAFATTCAAGTPVGSTCVVILNTGAGSGNQTWRVPSDFQSSGDVIACIGSGGRGSDGEANSSASLGGGGGGGAAASSTNITLSGIVTYSLGASATTTTATNAVAGVRETYIGASASSSITLSNGVLCDWGKFTGTASGGTGGSTTYSKGQTTFAGGNGGSNTAGTSREGGAGGGGSAGPNGAGQNGGGNSGSGTAGAGGGGSNGGSSSAGGNGGAGTCGGGGNGTNGTGGSASGGSSPCWADGTAGTGAGGQGSNSTAHNGGIGAIDSTFDASDGAGGGGGGGQQSSSVAASNGGTGATYGGGGGGGGNSSAAGTGGTGSTGGTGVIMIIYTPINHTVNTSNFTYCRTLTTNNDGYTDGIGTTTTGLFPLVATSTISNLEATSSGGHVQNLTNDNLTPIDVVFVDESSCSFSSSSTAIPFYFEHYASTTGAFVVHLGISNISSTTAKIVAMYYGNSAFTTNLNSQGQTYATTSPLGPAAIWNMSVPGYATTSYPDFLDSTPNANDGSSVGMTGSEIANGFASTTDGYVDGALSFNGTSQAIDSGSGSSLDVGASPFTLSFWVYIPSSANSADSNVYILSKTSNGGDGFYVQYSSPAGSNFIRLDLNASVSNSKYTLSSLNIFDKWTLVTITWDGTFPGSSSDGAIYLNGVQQTATFSAGSGSHLSGTTGHLLINCEGTTACSTNYVTGSLDDVRIYNQALTTADIQTIYNNTVSSAKFWTIGSEQTSGAGGGGSAQPPQLPTLWLSYRQLPLV